MSREREMILEMLKDGKITNDEALKLLDAIGENKSQEKKTHLPTRFLMIAL